MQNISEYEIIQKRIAERRLKKRALLIGIGLSTTLIALSLLVPLSCTLPLGFIALLATAQRAIEFYFLSPRHTPPLLEIEQELEWLFGEDWQETSGTTEYAFAQDRISKRQIRKWSFSLFHLLVFIPLVAFLTYAGLQARWNPTLFIPVISVIYIIWQGRNAFPTPARLAKIERKAGLELQRELQSIRPEKRKHEEKLKRQPLYEVGDDGELVEVEEELEFEEDKPKNDLQSSSR